MGNSYQACISTASSKQMILPLFPQHFSSMINKFKVFSRLSQAPLHYLWVHTPGSHQAFIVSTCECLSSYLQLSGMEQHLLQAMAWLRTLALGGQEFGCNLEHLCPKDWDNAKDDDNRVHREGGGRQSLLHLLAAFSWVSVGVQRSRK